MEENIDDMIKKEEKIMEREIPLTVVKTINDYVDAINQDLNANFKKTIPYIKYLYKKNSLMEEWEINENEALERAHQIMEANFHQILYEIRSSLLLSPNESEFRKHLDKIFEPRHEEIKYVYKNIVIPKMDDDHKKVKNEEEAQVLQWLENSIETIGPQRTQKLLKMAIDEEDNNSEKTYIEKDLSEYALISNLSGCSRNEAMESVLPNEAKIETASIGGYEGKLVIVIKLDGYIWMHNDYYGSCGYCDGFLENEKEWTEDMLRKMYCFKTVEDALQYINETDDYSWEDLKSKTKEILKEIRNKEE